MTFNRWIYCAAVALFTGLVTFPILIIRVGDKFVVNNMFSANDLSAEESIWAAPYEWANLSAYIVMKYLLISLSISCPIPAGVFTPTFTLGSAIGRLFGHVVNLIFDIGAEEGIYAVIGAAAFTASVTRTISVAMIVFELNRQISHLIPVMIGVLSAYALSYKMSIFDVLLDMKNLPYFPALREGDHAHTRAKHMMNGNFIFLTKASTLSDIVVLLQHVGS